MSQFTVQALAQPGVGNVTGPASSVNGDVVLFSGTTGKIISDSGVPSTGIFTINTTGELTGGGTVALGGTITLNVPGGGITWTDEAVSFQTVSNNGYFCSASLTATMPISPSQGDIIYIVSTFTGAVTLRASAGQMFRIGNLSSSTAGSCTSSSDGDAIEFVYRSADNIWYCSNSPQGNWSLS